MPPFHLNLTPYTTPLQNQPDSPSSPRSPLTPLSTHPSSSTPPQRYFLTPQTSSTSSSSKFNPQLSPPPRLHLRTLLPQSPSSVQPPPPIPYPWTWRCHLCNRPYNLAITRRCLEDGHLFCSAPAPMIEDWDENTNLNNSFDGDLGNGMGMTEGEKIIQKLKELRRKRGKGKRRNRKRGRGCRSEFDYDGWARWGFWRRRILFGDSDSERSLTYQDDDDDDPSEEEWNQRSRSRYQDLHDDKPKTTNCFHECDFPSACHEERKLEREWYAKRERLRQQNMSRESQVRKTNQLKMPILDFDFVSQSLGPRKEDNIQTEEQSRGIEEEWRQGCKKEKQTPPPLNKQQLLNLQLEAQLLLNLAQSSTISTLQDLGESGDISISTPISNPDDKTQARNETEAGLELGPLGIDTDGLGEYAYQDMYMDSKRGRNVGMGLVISCTNGRAAGDDDAGGKSPSSPLKMEFRVDDVDFDLGLDEGVQEGKDRNYSDITGDLESEEDFSRTLYSDTLSAQKHNDHTISPSILQTGSNSTIYEETELNLQRLQEEEEESGRAGNLMLRRDVYVDGLGRSEGTDGDEEMSFGDEERFWL